jgi:predicted RNA-binding protein with RPS1 domain
MGEAVGGVVTYVRSRGDAAFLASQILDAGRQQAVVCVTTPSWARDPLIDAERLAAELGDAARVFVMPTGDESWELTDRLPPRLDVYGGATRIWWRGADGSADPYEHPLFFAHDRSQSDRVIDDVVEAFRRRGIALSPRPQAPEPGTEVAAVVTAVRGWGAELTLPGGYAAFAHKSQLSSDGGLEPDQVVRPGQAVRVTVATPDGNGRRVPVSLRPFEPDPWQRVAAQYREGMLVEGVVDELRNYGAFVTLLPGARGLLHKSRISHDWVSHPEDYVQEGERVVVRIEELDAAAGKAELSLLDVAADAEPEFVAAIYEDGPPWLPPLGEAEIESDEVDDAEEPFADEEEQEFVAKPPEAAGADEVLRPEELASPALEPDLEAETEQPDVLELERLERAVEDGRELQRHFSELFGETRRRLEQLRAEGAQVRRGLESELADIRLRILEMAESESAQLVGSTEQALAEARDEAARLREQLAAVELDRRELLERLKEERARSGDAAIRIEDLRKQLRSRDEAISTLEGEISALGVTPEERFVAEVQQAWERMTTPDDRERYPWRKPIVGTEFLDSLERVEGVARSRVTAVCAHVVSGRAPDVPGLELHALRESDAGGAAQRVRPDGARAWRCNLQTGTAAARRLHYWQLPDGRVELGKVGYHDDFSIR